MVAVNTEFSYYTNGQLESRVSGNEKEGFLWDGLALIKRNDVDYINEPYVTGGNPILANDKVMFNDILGTTLGVKDGEKFTAIEKDAFGAGNVDGFFTGKPYVEGLGYSFLFRNYRPEIGKWQTADPAGYPDGWNNLAYCNNHVNSSIDRLGAYEIEWEGTWSQTNKDRITNSFSTVSNRMQNVVNQITGQITNISNSGRTDTATLLANLTTLKDGLQQTINNINSTSYNLEIYQSDLGDTSATYWSSPVPWYDDEITIDDDWFSSSSVDSSTIFHELTHTWSDDGESNNDYINAHMIESLFTTDFINWARFVTDYREIYGTRPE